MSQEFEENIQTLEIKVNNSIISNINGPLEECLEDNERGKISDSNLIDSSNLVNNDNPVEQIEGEISFKKHKKFNIIDSSDDEDYCQVKKSSNESQHCIDKIDKDKLPDVINVSKSLTDHVDQQQSILAALCDSESEEDADGERSSVIVMKTDDEKPPIEKLNNPKLMTAKEAALLRKEIQSESQKMIREKDISLPYHKPKCYSLKDFLLKRPKFILPTAVIGTERLSIKMSNEQLQILSKQLEKREEVVKEFYKSDSESDDTEKEQENQNESLDIQHESSTINNKNEGTEDNELSVCTEPISIINSYDAELQTINDLVTDRSVELIVSNEKKNSTDEIETEVNDDRESINYEKTGEEISERAIQVNTNDSNLLINSSEPICDFQFGELDKEIEDYVDEASVQNVNKNKPIILTANFKKNLLNITPKLSGQNQSIIDLDEGDENNDNSGPLMQRLLNHIANEKKRNSHPKQNVHLSIISVESSGDIQQESIDVNLSNVDDDEILVSNSIKLKNLKKALEDEITKKKYSIWHQKITTTKANQSHHNGLADNGKTIDSDEEIIEEEEELVTDEEDEEEIYDLHYNNEKPSRNVHKSIFIDDEADDHDCDDAEDVAGLQEVTKFEECTKNNETSAEGAKNNVQVDTSKKRVLLRIRRPIDDESDEENNIGDNNEEVIRKVEQLDSTISVNDDEDDDSIPPHQQQYFKTPIKSTISQSKSDFIHLTPISFLANTQPYHSSSVTFPSNNGDSCDSQASQLSKVSTNFQTSLGESEIYIDTQDTNNPIENNKIIQNGGSYLATQEPTPTTQDLLEICSGEFSQIAQSNNNVNNHSLSCENSQVLGVEQDLVISQLLDEDELRNFRKKFDSPTCKVIDDSNTLNSDCEGKASGGVIDSSNDDTDDDDGNEKDKDIKTSKKISRVHALLDDESSTEDEEEQKEAEGDAEYDSEENEVINDGSIRINQLKDFIEDEAELSEAEEWHGSDDEDEKHMDEFEIEAGDKEQFDEDEVRHDLEKIHMRQVLDQDSRELKILQELFLEDGELHGTGRQRQFKWKNIDLNLAEIEENHTDTGENNEINLNEEENEEQWRKMRHQRESFLQEQKFQKKTEEYVLNTSKIISVGRKLLMTKDKKKEEMIDDIKNIQNIKDNENTRERNSENNNSGFETNEKSFDYNRRFGSFLNRNDNVLQRVVEFTRATAANELDGITTSKISRNFVFKSLASLPNNKRKLAEAKTPRLLKKIRLNTKFLP